MKNKAYRIGLILCAATLILFVFYKISYFAHCIEPKACSYPIKVDGLLDEPDWDLEKKEFYLVLDPKYRTTNFSKFQFLRDSNYLYFGAQFTFDSTLTGYDGGGGVFTIENAGESEIQFQIQLDSKKLIDERLGDIEIEFNLENRNDEITGDIECERRGPYSVCDYIEVQQIYDSGTWNIELSVPLSRILGEKEKYINYTMDIHGVSEKEYRVHIGMNYPIDIGFFFTKYIAIKNLDK